LGSGCDAELESGKTAAGALRAAGMLLAKLGRADDLTV
jgi:hypothetical protein